jgi:hypothetical protein
VSTLWIIRAIALMMEAARTSETLVNFYQTARRYNPEDSHLLYELLPKSGRLQGIVLTRGRWPVKREKEKTNYCKL